MTQFTGFPAKTEFTPLPNIFFGSLLSEITDIIELKVILYFFETIYPKRGYPKFITCNELLNNIGLLRSLKDSGKSPQQLLEKALESAIKRGVLLSAALDNKGKLDTAYFLNTESNLQIIDRVQKGELTISGLTPKNVPALPVEPPDIFVVYEQNIGMLTPLIAEELREAERTYPSDWIKDAIKEAVSLNKRNWRYISRILERWTTEGRRNGTHQRYIKENTDPDKYIKGKYGHIVQR